MDDTQSKNHKIREGIKCSEMTDIMTSVCMATYNGERFIKKQLRSILDQIGAKGEVIVSDDGSTDGTIDVIKSFKDTRVKLFHNPRHRNVVANFENALNHCSGKYVFLADQDDIWNKSKVETFLSAFAMGANFIVSDARVVNDSGVLIEPSYFKMIGVEKGLIKNIYKNSYLGCCMAFERDLLNVFLPFPKNIVMHDIWMGLSAEMICQPLFIEKCLVNFRRHEDNVSYAAKISQTTFCFKLKYRLHLVCELVKKFGARSLWGKVFSELKVIF